MQYFQVTSDLLNSKNLKKGIAQLCNEKQVCNVNMLELTNIFQQNTLNAIVLKFFKFQVILLIIKCTEKSESNYYSLSY